MFRRPHAEQPYGERGAQETDWPRTGQCRYLALQEQFCPADFRNLQRSVPRGALQRDEPLELPSSNRGGDTDLYGEPGSKYRCWSADTNIYSVPADSVRPESDFVIPMR